MTRQLLLVAVAVLLSPVVSTWAQTVQVDISPAAVRNRFVPQETLGAGIDRIATQAIDAGLSQPNVSEELKAGWQPVSYRQNTELLVEAWHWNPQGTWSDAAKQQGYFTGSATPEQFTRHSFGYGLPHRGFTRNDGTGTAGYSRLTDGDSNSYWKSNPYLTQRFTGESDAVHPQWVVIDLSQTVPIDAIRITWAAPYATRYAVQYWNGEDPMHAPTRGVWQEFPNGNAEAGKGGMETIRLSPEPMPVRFLRIWMTQSSNTCDSHGSADPRNCVGYAIDELYLGTISADGQFHDILRHTKDQEQTTTYCSSVDPWHTAADLTTELQAQPGFDLFFTSGITRSLPAMVPIAMLYGTPEDSVAEIRYLENRKYPISYVEMGEEADGQYMLPEDYAALYVQWAKALHAVDPKLKLGGPSFQGVTSDILAWPDENDETSWTRRFLDYLKKQNALSELAFFSFEHYPLEPCRTPWSSLYEEPELITHIMNVWREDGVPAENPMFVTEGNLSWAPSETYLEVFSSLWLADYVGSFLSAGGKGLYFFHYLPTQMEHGCNDSPGNFGMFTVDASYHIQQHLAQFFAAQLINQEWVQPGAGEQQVFPASSDIDDGAGHKLVTAYAVHRPDGQYALLLVNRDQQNAHKVHIHFREDGGRDAAFSGQVQEATFGSDQYQWHPAETIFMAHAVKDFAPSVLIKKDGYAEPDGPIARSTVQANAQTEFELPKASVTVLRGNVAEL